MISKPKTSRRTFLHRSLTGAAGLIAAPAVFPRFSTRAQGRAAPNSRIQLAMIGVGRQSYLVNLPWFLSSPDVQVVAVCDVDAWRLEKARQRVENQYAAGTPAGHFQGCTAHRDFREVLARKDIDAVMIGTPDHWHALMAVEAAKAGKHVALEKPISLSVTQGRAISDAMKKYGRTFRTDTEVRASNEFRRLCEVARNGRLGKLRRIIAEVPKEAAPVPIQPTLPVPDELDYATWLGPAPEAPYTEKRVHTRRNISARPGWMIIRDYCDGIICNWGTHLLDIVQWGHNSERTGPVSVSGSGEFHPQGGLSNVLQAFEVNYRYADGVELLYRMTGRPAVRFEGAEGWAEAVWNKGIQAHPQEILDQPLGASELKLPLSNEKIDFVTSVKNGTETMIPAEVGHRTNSICQIGLISIELGEPLKWDPERERFIGHEEANRRLVRPMRAPWQISI